MKLDASDDDGAAQVSQPMKGPAGGQGHGQTLGYWPAWLVAGVALIFLAIQFLWWPATPAVDVPDRVAQAILCLIPLAGLFVVQHLRQRPRVYWPLMTGLSCLLLALLAHALHEVRVQPAIVGILIEDGLAVLGSALLVLGLVRWMRVNQQLLAEIQALNADLEQRVAARTATLEGEVAERQQAEARLRDSERRYRELNAVLEQRVAERTAEVQAANALLREREEDLQFILEGSRLGAWDWHIASGTVRRNDYSMLGYTLEEFEDATTHGWLELIHPDDRERVWQSIDDHLAGRTPLYEVEYRMRAHDGGDRWILDRARIVSRDGEGRPLRMSGTHEDITSRKHTQQALEESHQRLTTILNAMDAKVYLADMDTHAILFMNQPLLEAFGPAEGRPCYRVLQGLDAPCPFCINDKLVNADGRPAGVYAWEFQNQLNRRWYDLRDCAVRWTDGRLVRLEIATDVSERKRMELRLRQSEERFRLAFENANTGMCLVDSQGRFLQVNEKMTAIFGFSRQELEGMTVHDLTHPADLTVGPEFMSRALQGQGDSGLFEKRYRHRDGHTLYAQVASSLVRDHQGQPQYFIVQVQDVTARRRAEAELQEAREAAEAANRALQAANIELQHLATTDRLTGLWNRHYFDEAVAAEIGRVARYGEHPLSLLLFDLDHFKSVNDTHGHLVGDQVLIALTRRVRQHLRAADVLARWGGEEFVVLLPHTAGEEAVKLAENLRQLVAGEPFPKVGQVTSSFGVAEFRPDETRDRWLQRVDEALYAAKTAGRNRVSMNQSGFAE